MTVFDLSVFLDSLFGEGFSASRATPNTSTPRRTPSVGGGWTPPEVCPDVPPEIWARTIPADPDADCGLVEYLRRNEGR